MTIFWSENEAEIKELKLLLSERPDTDQIQDTEIRYVRDEENPYAN